MSNQLASERQDLTLTSKIPSGRIHPITQVIEEVIAIFTDLDFCVAEGPEVETDYNNFTDSNWKEIKDTFELFNNEVPEYHSKTSGTARPQNTTRCANTSGVADGSDDDVKGLINFIRGQDYFDYDADCNLTEIKENPLGDIYHSELVVVGAPSAETSFVSTNQESYWRSINGYDAWAEANKTRSEMI